MEVWRCSVKNWKSITKESGAIILAQGEALLKETTESAKLISAKGEKIFTIIVPITTALIVYLVSELRSNKLNILSLSALLMVAVLFVSIYYCFQNLGSYRIAVSGNDPQNILKDDFFDDTDDKEKQYQNILLFVCEDIQEKIRINRIENARRVKHNERALQVLLLIPLTPLIAYFFVLIRDCCCALP